MRVVGCELNNIAYVLLDFAHAPTQSNPYKNHKAIEVTACKAPKHKCKLTGGLTNAKACRYFSRLQEQMNELNEFSERK
jgi:hypothetical protein